MIGHDQPFETPQDWFPIASRSLDILTTHCNHLRTLKFSRDVDNSSVFTSADISDSDIIHLASRLPHLQSFEYLVEPVVKRTYSSIISPPRVFYLKTTLGRLSAASLIALGTHCRSLESLRLVISADLRSLDLHQKPLFPKLKHLGLCYSAFSHSKSRTEGLSPIIPILEHHFPNLKHLEMLNLASFGEDDVYSQPWELAEIFWKFGPSVANGFYEDMEYEYDGWFEDAENADEPSVWGDGLDESENENDSEDEFDSDASGYSDDQM
ncbi:hypothetical protein AOQ84DRAFT_440569 [Glonium stellatum]|uniref:Uncharacterized protein n=1 Tax=Glonium stellatum TaxID=574774 RepID=A0A8E2EY84_9PEZI|nr:hypothetical protein AOQ84DRAFT_440569 [Glonium stellatum]